MSWQNRDSPIETRVAQALNEISARQVSDFAELLYSVGVYLIGVSAMYIDSKVGKKLLQDLESLITSLAAQVFFKDPAHPALENLRPASYLLGQIFSTLNHFPDQPLDRFFIEAVHHVGEQLYYAAFQLGDLPNSPK